MFKNIIVPFLNILMLVSLLLFIIPPRLITEYLGAGSGVVGFAIAAVVGSITLIPGFISYPIAASLVKQGASYSTVAVFMTTLMMVGVVPVPPETKNFWKKIAQHGYVFNFWAGLIIGVLIGIIL